MKVLAIISTLIITGVAVLAVGVSLGRRIKRLERKLDRMRGGIDRLKRRSDHARDAVAQLRRNDVPTGAVLTPPHP